MSKPSVSAGVVAGVALGAAGAGVAAVAVRAACLQVARTRNGLARVKRVHNESGDEFACWCKAEFTKAQVTLASVGHSRLCVLSCV